jgi:hypothetical protein
LLRPAPLVSDEELDWQLACFEWLLRGSGGYGRFKHAVLVLPTDEFFPQRGFPIGKLEVALFDQMKEHAGMSGWLCALEIQEPNPDPRVAPTIAIQGAPQSPPGTFHTGPSGATITCRPDLIANPTSFVAIMAHELGHFLISSIEREPPGGEERLEFVTDIAAVFLGFGVFLVNSAFTFKQLDLGDSIGWSARTQGYLSEFELLNALSLFTVLLGIAPTQVTPYLKSFLRWRYRSACKAFAAAPALDGLRQISPIHALGRELAPARP